jgi:hypothetical protein
MNFAAETGSALKRTQAPRFNRLEQVSHFSRRFQSALRAQRLWGFVLGFA